MCCMHYNAFTRLWLRDRNVILNDANEMGFVFDVFEDDEIVAGGLFAKGLLD